MADAALLHMKIHIGRHDISVVAAQMANIVGLINAWLVLCKCKRMTAFHFGYKCITCLNSNIVQSLFWSILELLIYNMPSSIKIR